VPVGGDCTAGGQFTDAAGHVQGFVVNERKGRWQSAEEVPGLGALNVGGGAEVGTVRCASAGDCVAGGRYKSSTASNPNSLPGIFQPFVVSEHNDVWSAAQEVPGIEAINSGEDAGLSYLSCPSAGNCGAGGYYFDDSIDGPFVHPWVASEKDGRWGNADNLSGGALPYLNLSSVSSISCPSAGNCVVTGFGTGLVSGASPAWVATEKNGRWGTPTGIADTSSEVGIYSVSCPSAGNCTAVGSTGPVTLVVNERHGRWGKPAPVPGTAALTKGGASIGSISCPAFGKCSATGSYPGPRELTSRPFVVSQVR
jgi:hypothetical protein